jgi:hypothetical protein
MAESLIHTIQFVANNYGGGFVAGDVVRVYYDPDNDPNPVLNGIAGLRVAKNEVTIFSGADIDPVWREYKIETPTNYINCGGPAGTTAVIFIRGVAGFPYVYCVPQPNSASCGVDPTPCNLQFSGTPQIVPASAENVNDGSVTVRATSSRQPIQYKIGTDFIFDDPDVQTDGEFAGLYPGTYTIYIRDFANCRQSVQVIVGINNTFSPQYTMEYNDNLGNPTKVVIARRAWDGGNTDVIGGDVVFERQLRGEGSTDKFETILSGQATLKLTSMTDFQFGSIFTNDPNELRLLYYKDVGAGYVLKWTGRVLPQQYQEEYKAPPYYVSVVATDGLADLKNLIFAQDDGQQFLGSMRALELIGWILRKTGLEFHIRSAVNMYAAEMDDDDTDDPLYQAYVDVETYYLAQGAPNLEFVLRCLLEPFGARVLQENNMWHIVRVEELAHTYKYRDYTADGMVLITNGEFNPLVNVDVPSAENRLCWSNLDQQLLLTGGFGRIKIFYTLGLKRNILRNGDFRLQSVYNAILDQYEFRIDIQGFQLIPVGYGITESYEVVDNTSVAYVITGDANTTGEAYIISDSYFVKMGSNNSLKLTLKVKIPLPKYSTFLLPNFQSDYRIPYQRVRVQVQYGPYYLRADGAWTTTPNIFSFFVSDYQKYQDLTLTAPQPDAGAADGYDLTVKLFHSNLFYAEFDNVTDLKAKQTWDEVNDLFLPTGTRTELYDGTIAIGTLIYYELQQNTDAEAIPQIIRPDDYDAVDNPVQWVRVDYILAFQDNRTQPFFIDSIGIEFLTDGESAIDTVVRDIPAEGGNTATLERTIYHGSYSSIIETIPYNDFAFGVLFRFVWTGNTPIIRTRVQNILSPEIIYTGYFRSSEGVGYTVWGRDGVVGVDSMHGQYLKQYAAQYDSSWRKITGSLYSDQRYMDFLSTIVDVFNGEKLYIPISLTINDRDSKYNGEFLELTNVYETPSTPFASGFSVGFGQRSFN